ncbi:hypothetical protein Taro_051848 [Colocasia esculenta]|uniref:Retrotransposon gag domain-containing protein n=1 Tax=Colocasia esculenta TaxID=4460 RepID=A0A843XI18_COLES|nr:hypothetical protein [Colocasia esculenta]
MRSDPRRRDQAKYCRFHRDHGHDTSECRQLKDEIEDLIKRGYLRGYGHPRAVLSAQSLSLLPQLHALASLKLPTGTEGCLEDRGTRGVAELREEMPYRGAILVGTRGGFGVNWEFAGGSSVRARRTFHDRRPAQSRAVAVQEISRMADRRNWGGEGDDPEESTQRMIERIWKSLTDIRARMDQQAPVPPVAVPPGDGEAVPVAPVPPRVEVPFVAPVPPPPPVLIAEEPVMQVEKFLRLQPPTYSGGPNPDTAEHWVHEIERVFATMRCPAADRVVLAAYQLRGFALEWWRLKMQTTFAGRTEEAITWSEFLDVFNDTFFPIQVQQVKREQFRTLQQARLRPVRRRRTRIKYVIGLTGLAEAFRHNMCAGMKNVQTPRVNSRAAGQQRAQRARNQCDRGRLRHGRREHSKPTRLHRSSVPRPAPYPTSPAHTLSEEAITFSDEDLVGVATPHTDALVVSDTINHCNVRRILVDNGSAPDVLAYDCFVLMGLKTDQLTPIGSPLFGFSGVSVQPMGRVRLPITLGTAPKTVTKVVDFLVINNMPSYNAILGRGLIGRIRAVPSSLHQKMKFPTPSGIGKVLGCQR